MEIKKETKMPKEKKKKCEVIIHTAAAASAAAVAIPIPLVDTIPITATQIGMIVALGKVFEIKVDKSLATAIAGCQVTRELGRNLAKNITKAIPIVNILTIPINMAIATTFTEALGWMVADDFYKISIGEEPNNIISKAVNVAELIIGGNATNKSISIKKVKK